MATNPRGIVTPEAVVLDFETAGIASRALARTIDALIQGAALFALVLLVVLALPGSAGIAVAIVGVAAIVIGYPILCEVLMRGRSPGKAALGLRVVTVEGAPVSGRHAFIRSALGTIDFLVPPGGLFAVISCLLSPRGQRFGDLVAGTIVLRERSAVAPAMAVWFNPPAGLEGYAQTLDVTPVTDRQFAVVRAFLLRVQELAPEARIAMSLRLATPLAAAMHHQPPPGVHPELFLVCVAAAYQRRRGAPAPPAAPMPQWSPPPPSPAPAPIQTAPPPPPPPRSHPAPPPPPRGATPASPPSAPPASPAALPLAPAGSPQAAEPAPRPSAPTPITSAMVDAPVPVAATRRAPLMPPTPAAGAAPGTLPAPVAAPPRPRRARPLVAPSADEPDRGTPPS
jgi:uncharacterized RDD family membrane protein YckC